MAYAVKYRISYDRDKSKNRTTIDILENGYTGGTITNLVAGANPLVINTTGDINNIYIPSVGSGANINVYIQPLTLLELFTTDPLKWIVKKYNGNSGENLAYQGFINTGIYRESYSYSGLTPITISCNDGISLLDDIPYCINSAVTYTGLTSFISFLGSMVSKIGLTFTSIITNNDLQIIANNYNLFTYLIVNNENYYDENGKSMSFRQVVNSILQPLGLVMKFRADKIYFIDPINLHNTSKGKMYDMTGGTETEISLGGYLDISNKEVFYYETGQSLDVVKPFNSIEIKYDPFTYCEDGYEFGESGNYSTGTTWYNMSGSTDPEWKGDYEYTTGITYKGWNQLYDGATTGAWGLKESQKSGSTYNPSPIYVISRVIQGDTGGIYQYVFPYSFIKQDDNIMIELSLDTYLGTQHQYNIFNSAEPRKELISCYMNNIEIKVGNKWYNDTTGKWQSTQHYCKMYLRQLDAEVTAAYRVHGTWFRKAVYYKSEDTSRINDVWTTGVMYIPLDEESASDIDLLGGTITVRIFRGCDLSDVNSPYNSFVPSRDLKNILIKNINIAMVKRDKTSITNDTILTTLDMSDADTRKKTPLSITLTNGCGTYGSSKGAFSSTANTINGKNITGLLRDGSSTLYDTADLLGQSLLSQYNKPRRKLNMNLDVNEYQLDIEQKLIKDSRRQGDTAFYVSNGTYNDKSENFKCEMIEITNIRENII